MGHHVMSRKFRLVIESIYRMRKPVIYNGVSTKSEGCFEQVCLVRRLLYMYLNGSSLLLTIGSVFHESNADLIFLLFLFPGYRAYKLTDPAIFYQNVG